MDAWKIWSCIEIGYCVFKRIKVFLCGMAKFASTRLQFEQLPFDVLLSSLILMLSWSLNVNVTGPSFGYTVNLIKRFLYSHPFNLVPFLISLPPVTCSVQNQFRVFDVINLAHGLQKICNALHKSFRTSLPIKYTGFLDVIYHLHERVYPTVHASILYTSLWWRPA